MAEHYIEFENVRKSYGTGDAQINALSDANFHINKVTYRMDSWSF